jgi:flagellar biosynthetic protein FliP
MIANLCLFRFSSFKSIAILLILFLLSPIIAVNPLEALSDAAPQAPTQMDSLMNSPNPSEFKDFLNLHQQIRVVALLTFLSMIPFVLVMMTSFTRVTIIFHFLRQALATQQVPSNQIVIGLSLIITGFIMHPVINEIQEKAIIPYMNDELKNDPEVKMGVKGEDYILFERSWGPLRGFMLQHTREKDLQLFLDLAEIELPTLSAMDTPTGEEGDIGSAYDLTAIPWYCLVPSFVISELRIAFMMGFLLFMPFLVIDMVIASILMSMGMMMLPPVMISMPFKLLLFILIDGWSLIVQQIVNGFYPAG